MSLGSLKDAVLTTERNWELIITLQEQQSCCRLSATRIRSGVRMRSCLVSTGYRHWFGRLVPTSCRRCFASENDEASAHVLLVSCVKLALPRTERATLPIQDLSSKPPNFNFSSIPNSCVRLLFPDEGCGQLGVLGKCTYYEVVTWIV